MTANRDVIQQLRAPQTRRHGCVRGWRGQAISTVCLVMGALVTSGCWSNETTEVTQEKTAVVERDVIPLTTVLSGLQPEEFEVSVPRDLCTAQLNEWADSMLIDMLDASVNEAALRSSLETRLDDAQVERVLRRRFVLRDATHVRDMLWAQQIFRAVLADAPPDLEGRVARLFYHTMQTVQLVRDPGNWLPFGPYETAFFGQGRAADRAWMFATLLAQLRIPAAIVELPAPEEASTTAVDSLLVAVLVEDRVLLFDAALGLAVPGPDQSGDDVLPMHAATIVEALADDVVLRALDPSEEQVYPVTAERLKQAKVRIIGDSTLWSRRMEGLQNALTGDVSAIVFDSPVSEGIPEGKGTLERFAAALDGQIPAAQIDLWPWPEQQREARENLTSEQNTMLSALAAPFEMPLPMVVTFPGGPGTEADPARPPVVTFGTGWRRLQLARNHQIMGRAAEAIPLYLKMQSWGHFPPSPEDVHAVRAEFEPLVRQHIPPDILEMHEVAAEEAFFWRAGCQLQKRNSAAAASDLESYLTQTIRGTQRGLYAAPAALLCSIALAEEGKFRRGSAFLGRIQAGDPEFATARILQARWKARADAE